MAFLMPSREVSLYTIVPSRRSQCPFHLLHTCANLPIRKKLLNHILPFPAVSDEHSRWSSGATERGERSGKINMASLVPQSNFEIILLAEQKSAPMTLTSLK